MGRQPASFAITFCALVIALCAFTDLFVIPALEKRHPQSQNLPHYTPKPPAPACKVCHCGQTSCHRDCGTENMCNMRCEGLCKK